MSPERSTTGAVSARNAAGSPISNIRRAGPLRNPGTADQFPPPGSEVAAESLFHAAAMPDQRRSPQVADHEIEEGPPRVEVLDQRLELLERLVLAREHVERRAGASGGDVRGGLQRRDVGRFISRWYGKFSISDWISTTESGKTETWRPMAWDFWASPGIHSSL